MTKKYYRVDFSLFLQTAITSLFRYYCYAFLQTYV